MTKLKKCCATCLGYVRDDARCNLWCIEIIEGESQLYCDGYKPAPPGPVLRPPALAICSCCEGIGVAEQVLGEPGWKVRCSLGLCDIRTKDHRTRYEAHVAWNEGEEA